MRKEDEPFLAEVYAATRTEELAAVDWSEAQKRDFLQSQFNAQHSHYLKHYADADFLIILLGERRVGRLYVARWKDEIRLIDIALLPELRGGGLGTELMEDLLEEAAEARLPVRIHVEQFNRALGLYERLGFKKLEERGIYLFMEWRAPGGTEAGQT